MTTTTTNTINSINSAYTETVEETGIKYPALQASDYRPKLNAKLTVGIAASSWELLIESAVAALSADKTEAQFGDEVTDFFTPKEVRWIVLGLPNLFVTDKERNYEHLTRGMKLAGTDKKTVAKLFLVAIVGEILILDDLGHPQVFTLNLKSTKTRLIGKNQDKEGAGTLWSLNNALRKKMEGGKGSWYTSQFSIEIEAKPEKFTSAINDESSIGVMFHLAGGARILSEANQKAVFELLQDKDLRQTMKDPFHISEPAPETKTTQTIDPDDLEDEIAF